MSLTRRPSVWQVVVRLSHPASMELVLRKRVCINVYKRQSITDRLKKRMVKTVSLCLSCAVPVHLAIGIL